MPIRKAIWKSDAQFNRQEGSVPPVFSNVEVVGSGDGAFLALKSKDRPTENIPFTTPGNYIFDPTKIEILGGKGKLKAFVAGETNWPFTVPANYAYDSAKIEVVGGEAKLKGTPYIPYAQWHMNEVAGANVPDSSGNGRHATCMNMEDADWVPGKLNNCLRFNEGGTTDEYVNCASGTGNFDLADSFSFENWIKVLGWPSGNIRMTYKYDGTRGYLIYIGANRVYVFLRDKVFGGDIHLHGSTPINLDTWHHIIVTYDGSSTANGFEIYVDGNLNTKTILADTLTGGSIITAVRLKYGGSGVSYFLDGYLDETVIYEKVLEQSDVDARYNSGTGTENFLGSYAKDNPPITPNIGFAFNNPLGAYTETAIKIKS